MFSNLVAVVPSSDIIGASCKRLEGSLLIERDSHNFHHVKGTVYTLIRTMYRLKRTSEIQMWSERTLKLTADCLAILTYTQVYVSTHTH